MTSTHIFGGVPVLKLLGDVNGPYVAFGSSLLLWAVEAVVIVVAGVLIKRGVVVVVFFVASSFSIAFIFGCL